MSVFDAFGPLDERIQVLYQGIDRFVLLSNVDFSEERWTVYVALADKGCWWRAGWDAADVRLVAGANASAMLLGGLAENLANAIEQGALHLRGWPRIGKDSPLEIVFTQGDGGSRGPSAPTALELTELSAEEGAQIAADAFFNLGVSAQKRQCMLNPPAVTFAPPPVIPKRRQSRSRSKSPSRDYRPRSDTAHATTREPTKQHEANRAGNGSSTAGPTKQKPKVAKKARKVEKMEFASDSD